MEFISISLSVHSAHLAAREGHLPCLQSLVLAHENVLTAVDTRNDEVQYVLYVHAQFEIKCSPNCLVGTLCDTHTQSVLLVRGTWYQYWLMLCK